MAANRHRRSRGGRRLSEGMPTSAPAASGDDPAGTAAVFDDIQRVLDTPLAELMGTPEQRAEVEELTRQAVAVPAMARLREVVGFVGRGRQATQGGNLQPADALALAQRLAADGAGAGKQVPERIRSMADLPETAHAFRWAAAAEFVAWRGTRIVAGPLAGDLERDLLAAWLRAASTLLDHGLLGGFRQGWRKRYVEFLDASVGDLVVAIAEAGDAFSLSAIQERGWEEVAATYGYEPDDDVERRHVVRLVGAMVTQLADLGVVDRHGDDVVLSKLGNVLATMWMLSVDDDLDGDNLSEDDLVETDAASLLLVCVEEEMDPPEATRLLAAWCQARPAGEAADELCEAILDDDDPEVWHLGLDALGMLDPAVAKAALRRLRSHPDLGSLAAQRLAQR